MLFIPCMVLAIIYIAKVCTQQNCNLQVYLFLKPVPLYSCTCRLYKACALYLRTFVYVYIYIYIYMYISTSLRRADHSSRGVLPTVVRCCVWFRNLVNEEALTHWGLSRPKETNIYAHDKIIITYNFIRNKWLKIIKAVLQSFVQTYSVSNT